MRGGLKMKDNSLAIMLIITFGLSGIAVIALAWFWPALQSERITATVAGFFGVVIASIRALSLKKSLEGKRVTVAVDNES